MKKVLLIGFVLAICILAFPHGVLAIDQPPAVIIDATYGADSVSSLDVNLAPEFLWDLKVNDQNEKLAALEFEVNSLAKWDVTATDTYGGPYKGFLRGSVGPLITEYQMTVNEGAGGYQNLLTDGLIVKQGAASTSPQPWTESLRQWVGPTDLASSSGYHTEITFTLIAPF
jgi:hypothetical protein